MSRLTERYENQVSVIGSSGTQAETSSTTAKAVAGSTVSINPMEASDGLTFEWSIAGTKTATNAAHTVTLVGNGTTLITLTADDASAVDWVANIVLRFTNPKVQKLFGTLLSDTADPDVDYAAATADFTAGGTIVAYVTAGNSSDTVDAEMCIVKKWVQ